MESPMMPIYLDYNATTPMHPSVLASVTDALKNFWGNPSSRSVRGVSAKHMVEEAREKVADLIKASRPDEIVFVSGGTEANHTVIHSCVRHFSRLRSSSSPLPHIISSTVEHDAIRLLLDHYQHEGLIDVTFLPVSYRSGLRVQSVLDSIRPETCLITLMHANNETGYILPIAEIGRALQQINSSRQTAKQHRVYFHTDAAQTVGKIPVSVADLNVDYMTIVGHKFYGPRVGAVFYRHGLPLHPTFYGGGQEKGRRAGTENVGCIAGLGQAAVVAMEFATEEKRVAMERRRNSFEKKLKATFKDNIDIHCELLPRLPNTTNFSISDVSSIDLLGHCSTVFEASSGAACHAGRSAVSPVLLAFGVSRPSASGAVRISFGRDTKEDHLQTALKAIREAVIDIKLPASETRRRSSVCNEKTPENKLEERRVSVSSIKLKDAVSDFHNRVTTRIRSVSFGNEGSFENLKSKMKAK